MKRKNVYLNALQEVMTSDAPARPTSASLADLEISLGIITRRLHGPLSNPERLWLVEDKREIQKQIVALRNDYGGD